MATAEHQTETLTAERQKLRLQVERLALDVKDQRLRWFFKPPYLSVLVTVILALLAFLAALLSGWFDVEKQRLKSENSRLRNESEELQVEIRQLLAQRNPLQESVQQIRQDSALKTYALKFDRSQVAQEILDALPAKKDITILAKDQIQRIAKGHGLMSPSDSGQIQWGGG